MTAFKEQRLASLEAFLCNPELGALLEARHAGLNQFDLFELLDLYRRELVHSRILAWLLDPNQNHCLDDLFLKGFLTESGALEGEALDGPGWSEAMVQREWSAGDQGWLDILVVNRRSRILCAIENKVFSGEGIGEDGVSQLTRYRKALAIDFPDFARHHVFLSPDGREAQHEKERKLWRPMGYGVIQRLVEQSAADRNNVLPDGVRLFLQQYATTIRRNLMPESGEIQQLARKTYLENREVVDLLKTHAPNWVNEAKQWLKEAVAGQSQWKIDLEAPQFVRFRSVDWCRFPSTKTGTGWSPSESLMLFEFTFDPQPWLKLTLSPGSDGAVRERLFNAARQHPAVFWLWEHRVKDGWMVLHGEEDYILDDADYSARWDDGSARAKVMDWVASFARDQFPKMNDIIVNCLEEYEQERSQRRPRRSRS